jgi:hypothetical protein
VVVSGKEMASTRDITPRALEASHEQVERLERTLRSMAKRAEVHYKGEEDISKLQDEPPAFGSNTTQCLTF